MFKSIVPITAKLHKNKRVKAITSFDFAQNINMASVMVHEFSRVAPIYPIVFLEDKQKDEFRPVALMGLETGENLFVEEGKWKASYIPAIIRRYPFALAQTGEENKFTVCIDDKSEFVNEDEGQALFEESGEPSQVIERVKRYLGELQAMEQFTVDFCKFLEAKNMFTPLNMKVRIGNEIKNISGAYVINEERLNALSDEAFVELRGKRYLAPIYSHLSSLSQIERLLTFKDAKRGQIEKVDERFEEIK